MRADGFKGIGQWVLFNRFEAYKKKELSRSIMTAQLLEKPRSGIFDTGNASDPILPVVCSGYYNIDGVDHPTAKIPEVQFRTRGSASLWMNAVSVASDLYS